MFSALLRRVLHGERPLEIRAGQPGTVHHPLEPMLISMQHVRVKRTEADEGLGWSLNYFDEGRTILTYKHGMVAGYMAYIGMNTEKRIAVVVLCSNFNWDEKVGHNLLLRLSGAYPPGRASLTAVSPENSRSPGSVAAQRE